MQEAFDWNEEPPFDSAIEYQGLLRGLRRKKGFGLYFVQCSPSEGTRLIDRIRQDLPQKIEVLKFDAAMDGNFYQCVADYLQTHGDTEVLFVQGLEYSLLSYEATKREEGWSSEEIYSYSWKAVPRLLGNLNLQRERFRDNFPIRFVFLLPSFAMKYLIRRAPDFFDWRSGLFEFPSDSELLEQESLRILQEGNYNEYLNWTQPERDRKIAEIQCWIGESNQTSERKAQLFLEQGTLFFVSKQYEAAITSYDQSLKLSPGNYLDWTIRGIAFGYLKRSEEVVASFDQALKLKPDYEYGWYIRGLELIHLERYEEAVASFEPIKLKSDYKQAWYICGFALFNLERYEEAIANFCQALKLDPDNHTAWIYHSMSLSHLGRDKEATISSDQALKLRPDDYSVWHLRGIILLKLGRFKKAIASFNRALKLRPEASYDYSVWHLRGIAFLKLRLSEESIASFDEALKINPNDADTLYYKACCYGLQGQVELAISTLKQAIALDPKYREMAKTDADFKRVRDDDRFQALLSEQID